MELDSEQQNSEEHKRKLYTGGQVLLASFLGAPIAGAILLGFNYRAVGKPASGFKAILAGAVATIVLFTVAFFLPDGFPNFILPAAYCVAMYQFTLHFFGAEITKSKAEGKNGSWLVAAAVGIVCLVVLLLIIVAAVFLIFPDDGQLL